VQTAISCPFICPVCYLQWISHSYFCWTAIALRIETGISFETEVNICESTRRLVPDDWNLRLHRCVPHVSSLRATCLANVIRFDSVRQAMFIQDCGWQVLYSSHLLPASTILLMCAAVVVASLKVFRLWRRTVCHMDTNVSVKSDASIFRVEVKSLLLACRWGHYMAPKRFKLHGVTRQKTVALMSHYKPENCQYQLNFHRR
jgi:hypothetical protein